MEKLFLDDTIAAISTPIGKSGIGIVRLSGKDALSIADKIFISNNGRRPSQFPSHTIHYGWIINNSKSKKAPAQKPEYIDEALLTVMRAPRTYTKQDIVEINCHSGIAVLRKILELVLKCGARLAGPGEFTRRAYLSGRIDLTQAEAVLDVINSKTEDSLNVALGQLQGGLSRRITALRRKLLDILTGLEVSIDFSDQDIELSSQKDLLSKMQIVSQDLKGLLDTAEKGMVLREGITCVICGKANVGKSSLLNALLKRDRAIVSPIPGTTRDTLEETIDLSGVPLRLIDTAGIIRAGNLVEKEAVKRSRRYIEEADLCLLVLDASKRLSSEDFLISRYISCQPALIVLNKQDLPARINQDEVNRVLPGRKILGVSALYSTGLDELEKEIAGLIWQGKRAPAGEVLVTNIRHKQALKRARRYLQRAIKSEKEGHSAEIVILDIKEAQKSLGEITGDISCEDILERIFSQFCIGK